MKRKKKKKKRVKVIETSQSNPLLSEPTNIINIHVRESYCQLSAASTITTTAMTSTITRSISAGCVGHMGRADHSNGHASIRPSSIGSSMVVCNMIAGSSRSMSPAFATFPRFVVGRFLLGRMIIRVSMVAFFVLAARDAETDGFALHDCILSAVQNSIHASFPMSLSYKKHL